MPGKFLRCRFCHKLVYRDSRRINESRKRGWGTFCSQECLGESRKKGKILICSRIGCGKTFIRTQSDLKKVKKYYCSHFCAAVANNLKKTRICANPDCRKEFTGNKRKYCSLACVPTPESRYSKKIILAEIRRFAQINGRVPLKRELNHLYKIARRHFGTWNAAIKAAGFDPNPVMFANKHVAKDGHKCDSFAEKIIDDWLLAHKICHKRNIPYPANGQFTCDFVVGDKWIEFFGLHGELRRYDEVSRRKLNIARKSGVNLIKLYPKDVIPKKNLNLLLEKMGK